jgi:hypothetical protein
MAQAVAAQKSPHKIMPLQLIKSARGYLQSIEPNLSRPEKKEKKETSHH